MCHFLHVRLYKTLERQFPITKRNLIESEATLATYHFTAVSYAVIDNKVYIVSFFLHFSTGFLTELVLFKYHKHINPQKPFCKNIRCLFLDAYISFLLFRKKENA